jgi:hypothetical protein
MEDTLGMMMIIERSVFRNQIAAGKFMICLQVASYTLMHALFFGMPHFTLRTSVGRSEIAYTLAILALIAFGIHFLYPRTKTRDRKS